MADTEINIKLNGIQQIKKDLRDLKSELANATDPEQMAQLAEKAGLLSDKLKDANEKVAVFAAGSPFERTNNALGLMTSQLASLDFEGAAESAKSFSVAAKGINGEQIATQLKGLGGVVANLGKGFITLGATILTNPIFLITAAITAIIVIIGALLNKLGFLKPILNAIGDVFRFIGDVIDAVVDSIKDFLDWLGLTAFAAEESAARQQAALEKTAEARENELKKTVTAYDRKIAIANIEGKNTVDLERQKQRAIAQTEAARYKDLVAAIKAAKEKGDVDAEEIKKLKEKAVAAKEAAGNARFELEKINAQEKADNKKKNEEIEKSNKESYKKRLDEQKQYASNRLSAIKMMQDLELDLMDEGITKELAQNKTKYQRLIEDTLANEKLLSSEKDKIVALLREQEFEAQKEINQKYADDTKKALDEADQNKLNKEKEKSAALIEQKRKDIDAELQLDATTLETKKALLNEAMALELANTDLTENEKLLIKQRYAKEAAALDDKEKQEAIAKAQAKAAALQSIEQSLFSGIQALGSIFINDQKKLEKFNKAQALVQIGIDTAKAISALVANSQANPANAVTGGLAGVAQFASGIASILVNIAKAKQLLTNPASSPSGGGGGGGATAQSVSPQVPQINLFGGNNNANNLSSSQSVESNQSITVKAVVSETELTTTQNKVNQIKQAASL